jgi:tRNA threonylcarbamoyladenosine biosynthesis protein TsaE
MGAKLQKAGIHLLLKTGKERQPCCKTYHLFTFVLLFTCFFNKLRGFPLENTFSLRELGIVAEKAWQIINHGNSRVIALHGEMGAGKTTFTASLLKAMGSPDAASSPTFSIINQYKDPIGTPIYHMDWYRLDDEEEILQTGAEDLLYSGNWCLVEWSEKAPGLLPENTIHIFLSLEPDNRRTLKLSAPAD